MSNAKNWMFAAFFSAFVMTGLIAPSNCSADALMLQVLSPNGGETLAAGSTVDITWSVSAPSAPDSYDLYYTTNNGFTWKKIKSGFTSPNLTGAYSWMVPVPTGGNKTRCKVKVVARKGSSAIVGYSKLFAIEVLRVTSPNGGEIVSARTGTYPIGFLVSGLTNTSASAVLSYSVDGVTWPVIGRIAGITSGTYEFDWKVPAVSAIKKARVKVAIKNKYGVVLAADSSNTSFTLLPVFTVSGVVTQSGAGLAGVTMTLGGDDAGTTITGTKGRYSFTKLLKGNYVVSAAKGGFTFNPPSVSLAVNTANITSADFKAAPYAETTVIPPLIREAYVVNGISQSISVYDASQTGDVPPLRNFGSLAGLAMPAGIAVDAVNNEIFVANQYNDTITVYGRTANGNAAPVRTIFGTNTGLSRPGGIAVDTENNELFVSNNGGNSVTVYGRTANGNAAPVRTVSGASTGLSRPGSLAVDTVNNEIVVVSGTSVMVYGRTSNGNVTPARVISMGFSVSSPGDIAVDTVNNELFVANRGLDAVLVYGRTANGSVTPLRTICGASTGLSQPAGIAVDAGNNEVFVASGGSIMVYERTANGNAAPIRTISWTTNTVALYPGSITVDTVNNEILSANIADNSITVYGRTASGNVPPARTISGSVSGMFFPQGTAVDTVNDEIFTANAGNRTITVYGRLSSGGTVTPTRTIRLNTSYSYPTGIAIDVAHGEIFSANNDYQPSPMGPIGPPSSIMVYGRTADGDVAPTRTITSTGLSHPHGIALDAVHNEIFVTGKVYGSSSDSVTAYGRTATGDVTPISTITGTNTGLSCAEGIAVDTMDDEIFVANSCGNSITAYGRTASGNVFPLRTISGGNTGLSNPYGIAVDTVNNEIFATNKNNNSITVYARTANGDIAPKRTISGASTGLAGPGFSALAFITPQAAAIGSEFSLRPGQYASIIGENLTVYFKSVPNDSRCPVGAECFWAGNAEVEVVPAKTGTSPSTVKLNTAGTPAYPNQADYLNYSILLTGLQPDARLDPPIAQSDYLAKFIVSTSSGNPSWVDELIAEFQNAPVGNPPQSIWRYTYEGNDVYYIPAQCCDQMSILYNANGDIICAPSGGLIGSGDGRCTDFFTARSNEKLIWKDARTRY